MQLRLRMPPSWSRFAAADAALIDGVIARLVVTGAARSRNDVAQRAAVSRTVVNGAVRRLQRSGLICVEVAPGPGARGRPPERLRVDATFGTLIVVACDGTEVGITVLDMERRLLAEETLPSDHERSDEDGHAQAVAAVFTLLERIGAPERRRVVVLSGEPGCCAASGDVEAIAGPPGLVASMGAPLGAEVLVEAGSALRALGEYHAGPTRRGALLYLEAGERVSIGVVGADGRPVPRVRGSAGDIGHSRVPGLRTVCSCGREGCLSSVATIPAMSALLSEPGAPSRTSDDVRASIRRGDPAALEAVRSAGRGLGEILVQLIHVMNPERIVLGGSVPELSDHVLAGARSVVYSRATPLTTRNLTVERPALETFSAVAGAAAVGTERLLESDMLGAPRSSA